MKKKLTFEQRIHNAQGSQKVEEYKARHAYLHGVMYSREEWDVFWYKSKNTTWAHQFGRMVGWDEVYHNSVAHMDSDMGKDFGVLMEHYPEFEGHDIRSSTHSGCHVLASDVIEVAEDGKSARSFYLTPGTMTAVVGFGGRRPGRSGGWLWERYGSEFVFVNDEWKWFHEQVCPDIAGHYDIGNWAHDRYEDYVSGKLKIGDLGGYPARLTEPGTMHYDYSIVQTVQDTVPPPKPYYTLDDNNTYSPGRTDPTDKIVKEGVSHEMVWDERVMDDNFFEVGTEDKKEDKS